jgi:hypothetical protein
MNLHENVKFTAGGVWHRNFLPRKEKACQCRSGVSGVADKSWPRFSLVID